MPTGLHMAPDYYPVYRSTVNIEMLIYEDNFVRGKN